MALKMRLLIAEDNLQMRWMLRDLVGRPRRRGYRMRRW